MGRKRAYMGRNRPVGGGLAEEGSWEGLVVMRQFGVDLHHVECRPIGLDRAKRLAPTRQRNGSHGLERLHGARRGPAAGVIFPSDCLRRRWARPMEVCGPRAVALCIGMRDKGLRREKVP
jgi:hypothetical protein